LHEEPRVLAQTRRAGPLICKRSSLNCFHMFFRAASL
jgi:hypothetical protein